MSTTTKHPRPLIQTTQTDLHKHVQTPQPEKKMKMGRIALQKSKDDSKYLGALNNK